MFSLSSVILFKEARSGFLHFFNLYDKSQPENQTKRGEIDLFRTISRVLVYVLESFSLRFCSKRIDFRAILRNTMGTPVDWGLSPGGHVTRYTFIKPFVLAGGTPGFPSLKLAVSPVCGQVREISTSGFYLFPHDLVRWKPYGFQSTQRADSVVCRYLVIRGQRIFCFMMFTTVSANETWVSTPLQI